MSHHHQHPSAQKKGVPGSRKRRAIHSNYPLLPFAAKCNGATAQIGVAIDSKLLHVTSSQEEGTEVNICASFSLLIECSVCYMVPCLHIHRIQVEHIYVYFN